MESKMTPCPLGLAANCYCANQVSSFASAPAKTAVLLLAHGSPENPDQIPEFLSYVTGGRALPPAVKAASQSAQEPVGNAELNEEQKNDQFIKSREHGGVGLAVVGIDDAGERIPHLNAADLAGNLSRFEDELESKSKHEAD